VNMQQRSFSGANNILFLLTVNNQPAAISTVGLYQNIAYLAEAGTLPEYRKLGLHTYLSLYCAQYAYQQAAHFAVVTCTHDAITNCTAKRAGFKLLWERQLWMDGSVA
jgi:hypothetical protein